jgi:hypothetical protein
MSIQMIESLIVLVAAFVGLPLTLRWLLKRDHDLRRLVRDRPADRP